MRPFVQVFSGMLRLDEESLSRSLLECSKSRTPFEIGTEGHHIMDDFSTNTAIVCGLCGVGCRQARVTVDMIDRA